MKRKRATKRRSRSQLIKEADLWFDRAKKLEYLLLHGTGKSLQPKEHARLLRQLRAARSKTARLFRASYADVAGRSDE